MHNSDHLSSILRRLQAHARRPLMAPVVVVSLATGTLWNPCVSNAASGSDSSDIAQSVNTAPSGERSVLVEKNKVSAGALASGDQSDLQPISATTEQEPQLAEPQPILASSQSDVVPATKVTAVRVAANAPAAPPMPSNLVPAQDASGEASEAPVEEGPSTPKPSSFHGVKPGSTTKQELIEAWGTPDEVAPTDGGQLLMFHLESFRGVEVLIERNVVALMKINLHTPADPKELAAKVRADFAEAVEVTDDESGRVVAHAYPDRGIVMVLDVEDDITPESSSMVSQMLLQPLDAQTFCLRAEQRPSSELGGRIADLECAVEQSPREAHAHWLLSEALLEAGRAVEAREAAERAVDLEPEVIAYRQRLGAALAATGRYDDAVLETREVLDDSDSPTLVRARALHQMGLLASLGDAAIADKSVSFHNMAIAEADKLATSDNQADRRAAKRLLVEAHLAIAEEISRRDYNDKLDNVAQWVSRASAFAEELIENDGGDLGLRIRVAQKSLAALANFKPAGDPDPLIEEINDSLDEIKQGTPDPLWMDQLEWTTGVAYLSALQIEHHRRHPKKALEYSERAIELLADKAEQRRDNPAVERLIGKLYFHIGAVHAVHETKHEEAVIWYDRAFPLLTKSGPNSELVVPRHEGEALVSMAVSYWEQNDKKQAITLTEMGADLIEQAVTGGVMDKATLGVPYGNLAVMHKKLGDNSESQRYARLAQSLDEAKPEASTTQAKTDDNKAAPARKPGVAANAKPASKPTALKPTKGNPSNSRSAKTAQRGEGNTTASDPSSRQSTPKQPRRGARGRTLLR